MLTTVSQTEKNKSHMISFLCGIQRKQSKPNENKPRIQSTDRWFPGGWGDGRRVNSMVTPLLCVIQMPNYGLYT